MDLATFRMHASHLHLPRTLRREISNRGLYLYLQPGFTEAECERILALSKKGLPLPRPAPVVQQPPQNTPQQFPRADGSTGPVYIIYQQYPTHMGMYNEEESDEEEDEKSVNWVLPLSLILIIIAIVAALLYLNPSLIPAWLVTLLS